MISCKNQVEEPEVIKSEVTKLKIEDLKWLEGKWVDYSTFGFRNMTYIEDWVYYKDSLSGRGLSVENGDTTVTERFALRIINDQLMYVARPVSEPMIGFPAIKESTNEIIFQNKAHDFPSKITYVKQGADSLLIELNGTVFPQGDRTMKFKLKHL